MARKILITVGDILIEEKYKKIKLKIPSYRQFAKQVE